MTVCADMQKIVPMHIAVSNGFFICYNMVLKYMVCVYAFMFPVAKLTNILEIPPHFVKRCY